MKGAVGRIAAVLLACLLFLQALVILAGAEEASQPYGTSGGAETRSGRTEERVCETINELLAELEKDIGGTIGFSGDGPFIVDFNADIFVTKPVTVSLPPSGIEIVGCWLVHISGPVTFTGTRGFTLNDSVNLYLYDGVGIQVAQEEGDSAPVAVYMGVWANLYADSSVTLSAYGDNAIAVYCADGGSLYLGYAEISAVGNGAIGVCSEGDLYVQHAFVRGEGDGSYAIRSAGETVLIQVSATGSVEADTGDMILCSFNQPPSLIEYSVEPMEPYDFTAVYQDHACSSPPVAFPKLLYHSYVTLVGNISVGYNADWDMGGLEYSVPGDYIATATLQPVMPVPGLSISVFTHEIAVVPPNRAALYDGLGCGTEASIYCLAPIRDAEQILFWIYEEENGWRELTATGQAEYDEDEDEDETTARFALSGLRKETVYWSVAQVIGGPMEGFSNLYPLYSGTWFGGDRTGTDRYGTKPTTLPPTSNTGPETPGDGGAEGNGTGGNGTEDNRTGGNGTGGNGTGGNGTGYGRSSTGGRSGTQTNANTKEPQVSMVETATAIQNFPTDPAESNTVKATGNGTFGEEAPAPSLPEEWEDENTIAITGKRLLALLQSGEPVTFIKHGARVVVDRDVLLALQVTERQLFTVTVERLGDAYIARFALDGTEIDLPYMLLLPMAPTASPAADPAAITPILTSPPQDTADSSASLPLAGGIIGGFVLTLSGGYLLVRKRLPRR